MSVYLMPVLSAFAVFFVIAITLTFPWAFYQYRKYGYFSFWKSVIVASFIFYMLSAFFLVTLPMPDERENCAEREPIEHYMQTTPFQFVKDIEREGGVVWSDFSTYRVLPGVPAFYQLVFNMLLLLPLGVYLRYLLKRRRDIWKAVVAGFLVSLFFEITQLTALYGYYTCPYRLFDVDDLFANTLGATIGYMIAPLFFVFIPKREELKRQSEEMRLQKEATKGATLFALILDILFAKLLANIANGIFGIGPWTGEWTFFITLFIMIVLLPLVTKGQTLGSALIRLRYEPMQSSLSWAMVKRYVAIIIPYISSKVAIAANAVVEQKMGYDVLFLSSLVLLNVVVWLIVIFHILRRLWKKDRPYYFDAYSGIRTIRKEKKEGK